MSTTDVIADMLTRIRNALMAGHPVVAIPSSKLKLSVVEILRDEGFIEDFIVTEEKPQSTIRVRLKYVGGRRDRESVIGGLKRVSKPGRRVYVGKGEIPWVLSGLGIAVMSTPKGVITGDQARRLGVGGEVLCYVW